MNDFEFKVPWYLKYEIRSINIRKNNEQIVVSVIVYRVFFPVSPSSQVN